MFTTEQLPRSFFSARGRGYNAHSSRNIAATETGFFIFYNHRSAATAARKLLLITGASFSTQQEAVDVIVGRTTESAAVQDAIEALANTGASVQPLHFDTAGGFVGDAANLVFARNNGAPVGVTFATFHRDHVNPDLANQPATLEFPLILPPGAGLVFDFNDAAVGTRQDFLNIRFFRA